jgi:FkbM family methyltransferase
MRSLFWHRDQGLWNHGLVQRMRRGAPHRIAYLAGMASLVGTDTAILAARVLGRRARSAGVGSLLRSVRVTSTPVLYLDIGLHQEAAELIVSLDKILGPRCEQLSWAGFEANPASLQKVRERLAGRDGQRLVPGALVLDVPESGELQLFLDDGDGKGDSLYREGGEAVTVPAFRLSDWLEEQGIALDETIVILRMNIEGAERPVIQDLIAAGLADKVDGWYGLWDDVGKIDPQAGDDFARELADAGIDRLTFNGRDLKVPFRWRLISYDVQTSLLRGLERVER